MALNPLHDLHRRRASRNMGMLLVLLALVAIVFGLSVVKIQRGDMMEGFDHRPRSSVLPRDPDARPREPAAPVATDAAPGTTPSPAPVSTEATQ